MDVTLVVTYDVSRLYMLDGLCLTWGGPISASVYQAPPSHALQRTYDCPPTTRTDPCRRYGCRYASGWQEHVTIGEQPYIPEDVEGRQYVHHCCP